MTALLEQPAWHFSIIVSPSFETDSQGIRKLTLETPAHFPGSVDISLVVFGFELFPINVYHWTGTVDDIMNPNWRHFIQQS